MNRADLERYAKKLDATGLRFARRERDGSGNVHAIQELDWQAVILRMARDAGWTLVEEREPAKVLEFPRQAESEVL